MGLVYDCFTFYNEFDVLEIRLRELYSVVDQFVIIQGDHTFQGTPHDTARYFERMFTDPKIRPYWRKLGGGTAKLGGSFNTPWERETFQRNHIGETLKDLFHPNPDDTIILSDADEIPRREIVEEYAGTQQMTSLELDPFFYALNVKATDYKHTIKMLPYSLFTTAQEVRTEPPSNIVPNAGWHFSYLGSPEFIKKKLQSYSHTEFAGVTLQQIHEARMMRKPFWMDGQFEVVDVDSTWPHAVIEDRDRWNEYIWRR